MILTFFSNILCVNKRDYYAEEWIGISFPVMIVMSLFALDKFHFSKKARQDRPAIRIHRRPSRLLNVAGISITTKETSKT